MFSSHELQLSGPMENKVSCLKMPLALATGISPIVLLQDKCLWNRTCDRKLIMDV